MIDVNFTSKPNTINLNNASNSMIILGKGDSEFNNLTIYNPKSIENASELFGEKSDLVIAYKEAVDLNVSPDNIFLCNCYKFTDYLKALEIVDQNNFLFVVPLFDMSTTFISSSDSSKTYLAEIYSLALEECFSLLLLTDKHASLYEDFDHFIKNMKSINYKIKDSFSVKDINGENISFVLNNLKDYTYANIVLASILMNSNLRYYPLTQQNVQFDLGQVVYDIRDEDLYGHEIGFFAEDYLSGVSIENLRNYKKENTPEKMLLTSLIINKINNKLDFGAFTGKMLNSFTVVEIESYTKQVMQSFVGKLIQDFKLEDVKVFQGNSGEVYIDIFITIKTYLTIEKINIKIEV